MLLGPAFAEMRDPSLLPQPLQQRAAAARERPLDPDNLFNIGWKNEGAVPRVVLPEALTGVRAPIVVLSGRKFPTGSHKVGPAYSVLDTTRLREDYGIVPPGWREGMRRTLQDLAAAG